MATLAPPPSKKQKLIAQNAKLEVEGSRRIPDGLGSVRVQFVDQSNGTTTGGPVAIPLAHASVKNLELLLNSLQGQDHDAQKVPYQFSFQHDPDGSEVETQPTVIDISSDLYNTVIKPALRSTEDLITLQYTPQSVFRVRAITRCSAAISGHGQAILATQFSPRNSSRMVSGSGDGTARIWDCETGTPFHTLKGHTSWVLVVSYSPDGDTIATGSMDNTVRLWNASNGKALNNGQPLRGHTRWITSLAWEPLHRQHPGRPRLASASKDASVRVWDVVGGRMDLDLSRHKSSVSCVKWGGSGYIYTASQDKTVMVFDANSGSAIKTLTSHAHWVNHLALSSEFVLRTGPRDPTVSSSREAADLLDSASQKSAALDRFQKASRHHGQSSERLISASDDHTVFLWDVSEPTSLKKPITRLHGHLKPINHATFSADGRIIASSSFDNTVKLWRASDGAFLRTLKGHVGPVYQSAFSTDGRLLVSVSADTTVKVWEVQTGKLVEDLCGMDRGHRDEVFAVDWSPDGKRVGTGGKDKVVRIWTS
ncbi:MAG: hypothetical protein M1831_007470 [Alyxoria varia]|nr:MAG: hypothetical protein M1831_007470 [Alyxoria varia]